MAEITSLKEAVVGLVPNGAVVALEGFTHLIPFAAGHEMIRQGRHDLTLIRMTPDFDIRPADRNGLRDEADLLVGWKPGGGLSSSVSRCRREGIPGPTRARGAQPCRDGNSLRGGRLGHAFRCAAWLLGH